MRSVCKGWIWRGTPPVLRVYEDSSIYYNITRLQVDLNSNVGAIFEEGKGLL